MLKLALALCLDTRLLTLFAAVLLAKLYKCLVPLDFTHNPVFFRCTLISHMTSKPQLLKIRRPKKKRSANHQGFGCCKQPEEVSISKN